LSIPARNTPELNAWHAGCSLLYVFVRSSQAPQAGRSVAVALFQDEASAQHAVQTLKGNGVDESQVATFVGDAQADLVATLTGLASPTARPVTTPSRSTLARRWSWPRQPTMPAREKSC
jgi:hypothetical protein